MRYAWIAVLMTALVTGRATAQVTEFRWAGDPEGGAPYVEASPSDPNALVGFDVEIAALMARGLGRTPSFVFVSFYSIDQSIARGDADIGLSGIEDTPTRRRTMAVTVPYYQFREVLSVRDADAERLRTLRDLGGRKVGTLAGTLAWDILQRAQADYGVEPVSYEDDVHPFADLVMGRIDAVLLDNVLANRRQASTPGYTIQPDTVATSHYVGVLAPQNAALRDRVDETLREAMRSGELERIFRRWNVWNEEQAPLFQQVLAGTPIAAVAGVDLEDAARQSVWGATLAYFPALLRAALVTLILSALSMGLAVALGVLIASGRVYGAPWLRLALTGYVELMRGTPVLLQLFVLYYGIATAIRLPAFVAAFLGLALNYAAYESEIYRSALDAISRGQLEAARTLGFTESQILRLIRGPQAFRIALAPMTNDFVALLKDSSLVSVLTVMELTKQTQIFATNLGSWLVPGILCASLYLAMSLPLSALARRLEARWKAPTA
mgnify:CR=1 FL=1